MLAKVVASSAAPSARYIYRIEMKSFSAPSGATSENAAPTELEIVCAAFSTKMPRLRR
jgi:hypothetical protein